MRLTVRVMHRAKDRARMRVTVRFKQRVKDRVKNRVRVGVRNRIWDMGIELDMRVSRLESSL
jgi:hypothetical protein